MAVQTDTESKDERFIWYIAAVALAAIATLLIVKTSENEKFAPIKAQVEQESRQMNIRVITESYELNPS